MRRTLAWVAAAGLCSAGCSGDDDATGGAGATGNTAPASAGPGSPSSAATGGAATTGSSAGGAGAAGGGATGGAGGGAPPCTIDTSGPIEASADGQVIEKLHITSTAGPALVIDGFSDVVVRDLFIEHAGGPGIAFSAAPNLHIERVHVVHTGAPPDGANDDDGLLNISGYASDGVTINHVKLERGSSGVYLLECQNAALSFVEGHDFRGPFPRGQLVQLDKSSGAKLEDFSVENPQASSWPEDNVNVYQSVGVEIRRGLVDGNNSPSGVGVIFDGDMALGVVEDVDAVRMGNGCFSDYAGSDGVVFRRTRCRENICGDQGRGLPLSGALMWCGHPGFTNIQVEDSHWFAACNPGNIAWPQETFSKLELAEQDFSLNAAIALSFCWE